DVPAGTSAADGSLRQGRDGDQSAAVAFAVRVEQRGVTRGAQPRVLDTLRVDARFGQQLLVRRPKIEHHATDRRRPRPALPAGLAEGIDKVADDRLAD